MQFKDSKYKIDIICRKLKIEQNVNLTQLSGGVIRKVSLAKILLEEPNVLFLDEPTNHLDIESIEWLEKYLNEDFKGAFIVVSHDRRFLSNVTNKVFWMDRGNIKVSPKGFKNFETWSSQLIEQEKRELKNKNNTLKQELEWLSKGVKARRKRNERRKENVKLLEKEFKAQKSDFLKSISTVKFNQIDHSEVGPNIVAQLFNVSKKYNHYDKDIILLDKFDYKLSKGEKIGFLGKNGIGKSTLLKLIVKEIDPDFGTVKLRENIGYSYFDQKSEQINDNLSLKQNLIPNGGDYLDVNGSKKHICGYLKNFLFDPSNVDDKVKTLSGGQKNRLLLAKILANPKQLLVLDEPTNDLDLETLDMLIDFLDDYNGTALIASHDRDFLDQVTNKIFFFRGGGKIEVSVKPCDQILKSQNEENPLNDKKNNVGPNKSVKQPINLNKKIKQIVLKIEKIENLIKEYTKILEEANLYDNDRELFFLTSKKIELNQKELQKLEFEWRELEEKNLNN